MKVRTGDKQVRPGKERQGWKSLKKERERKIAEGMRER